MTGPAAGEGPSSFGRRQLEAQFERLIAEMLALGFDPVLVGSESVDAGVVDAVVDAMRQMARLLKLEPGFGLAVQAKNLIRGMVIDYSPMTSMGGREPQEILVDRVEAGQDGMVVIYGQDGYVADPVCDDFRFDLVTPEVEAQVAELVGAEQRRLGLDDLSRMRMRRGNTGERFRR